MTSAPNIEGPQIVFACYRPKAGKAAALLTLVRGHHAILREAGLATARAPILVQSADETVIEVFEWASGEAAEKAHAHPDVAALWEKMGEIADFVALETLPEAAKPFAHFRPVR